MLKARAHKVARSRNNANLDQKPESSCLCCTPVLLSSPLDAAEGVLVPLLGLDLKIEGACCGGASGKVDAGDLLKTQVNGRLVDVDEASLQWIEEARGRFVGAGDALSPRVTAEQESNTLNCVQLSSMNRKCILKARCPPLEVARHGDLAVDQRLHHPADHLVQ